ncbi:MAG: CPBP family intramembrane metalloprotease [Myxococcaceae bacterium]|nr:CPBP family intramembrane metalloprotease [Myxococcaceae bacterium]
MDSVLDAIERGLRALGARLSALPPIRAIGGRYLRLGAAQQVLAIWAASFLSIVFAFILSGGPTATAKIVATVSFLYLPLLDLRRRDEDYPDYGITLRAWRTDLKLFLILFGIVGPLYVLGFWAFAQILPELPVSLSRLISPYTGERPHFAFRLPNQFPERVIDNLLVVALPEEFFYRGFVQTRLRDAWPEGRVFFGARLGRAFWVTAVLFAIGHLAIFQAWRLAVVFPALLFGWMRERTGTVIGSSLFHAAANILSVVLEACFFGRQA